MATARDNDSKNKRMMKSELNLAMKHRDLTKQMDRDNEAMIDELHKNGPPMM